MESKKLKYPLGRQDFASIREDGCVYIDKTGLIYQLINEYKYVFLARPRRFGKSLLLSTIRYYFEGRKDLFQGLKITNLNPDKWEEYPVLNLLLSRNEVLNDNSLFSIIDQQFNIWEKKYKIIIPKDRSLSARFSEIIFQAHQITGKRVVILIDEYDNPLINTIHLKEQNEKNLDILKSIYSNLKDLDNYIQFSMLTGVSRFSKTSIFSGLNNINDITFNEKYSTICGFTEEEIRQYLWEGVKQLAEKEKISADEAMELLKYNYDGYHFAADLRDVYNPFSLINCLNESKIREFWFDSGTPSFLINKIKETKQSFSKLFNPNSRETELQETDTVFRSPVALLYQTGYLTIKSLGKRPNSFILGMPNREVESGLLGSLLGSYYDNNKYEAEDKLYDMADLLKEGNPEEFLNHLKSFIAGIPYTIRNGETEQFFQRNMYIILKTLGLHVHTEFETSDSRIDLLVETPQFVYVMELKAGKSAKEALNQIHEKDYSLQWQTDNRNTFLIGISFSTETRNISDWIIETQS